MTTAGQAILGAANMYTAAICEMTGGSLPRSAASRQSSGTDGAAREVMTRWRPWAALMLSVLGLAVAVYLTYSHYSAGARMV